MAQREGVFDEDSADSGVSPVLDGKIVLDQDHRNANVEHAERSAILVRANLCPWEVMLM